MGSRSSRSIKRGNPRKGANGKSNEASVSPVEDPDCMSKSELRYIWRRLEVVSATSQVCAATLKRQAAGLDTALALVLRWGVTDEIFKLELRLKRLLGEANEVDTEYEDNEVSGS